MTQTIEFPNDRSDSIRRYPIVGSRRLSNFFWAMILGTGGFYFLLTGLSSYFGFALLPFIRFATIVFFPQGIVMCFYGSFALFLSLYLWLTIWWKVGGDSEVMR